MRLQYFIGCTEVHLLTMAECGNVNVKPLGMSELLLILHKRFSITRLAKRGRKVQSNHTYVLQNADTNIELAL